MAENLLTRSLHTKQKYAEQLGKLYEKNHSGLFHTMKGNTDLDKQIENLQAKEKEYYDAVDAKDYTDFKNRIGDCITADISRGLSQLAGATLRKNLYDLKSKYQTEETEVENNITLIVDVYGIAKANKGINSVLDGLSKVGKTTRLKGGKVKINLGLNPKAFKQLFNTLGELEDTEGRKQRGRKYSTDNQLTSALQEKIKEAENNTLWVFTEGDDQNKSKTSIVDKLKISQKFLGYPWNFNASDVKKAINEGEEAPFRQSLIEALEVIKDWLLSNAGTTQELRIAINEEWDKVVGKEYNNLTNAKFFLKGGYIELVVGALGEFQVAVFQNLLTQKFPKMREKFNAAISGNVFTEGTSEQSKADVLFGVLGIQVKNYASPARPIEGNIHPYELTKYYSEERLYDSGFFGMLANRYWIQFNGPSLADIAVDLEGALSAILNFNSLDAGLEDKISFYMIAGSYLVPASVILSNFKDIRDSQTVIIDPENTSAEFESDISNNLYWEQIGDSSRRTKKNEEKFENLLKKSITLRANFKYNKIPDLVEYKII